MIVPSESEEFDALKDTANGATPEVGVAVKLAVGSSGGGGYPPAVAPGKKYCEY